MKSSSALPLSESNVRSLPQLVASDRAPISWYAVMSAKALARGQVRAFNIGQLEGVVYRDEVHGKVHALDAHCAHLGASLEKARVVGQSIQCPLHHFRYGPDGACVHPPQLTGDNCPKMRTYPSAEAYGLLFVYNGKIPRFALPELTELANEEFEWVTADSVPLACTWQTAISNSFDLDHFQTVHRRSFAEPPIVEVLDRHRARIRYRSRVSGDTLSDRAMRALSKNDIRVCITCHGGTTLVIETITARTRTSAVVSAIPDGPNTRIQAAFSARTPKLLRPLALPLARWLFMSFMQRDVEILSGARLDMDSPFLRDPSLRMLFEFFKQLPTEDA
jgi:phenylpropionate dioxygenase-like ring-hydroxylating dioxygenase large terminal subunit